MKPLPKNWDIKSKKKIKTWLKETFMLKTLKKQQLSLR